MSDMRVTITTMGDETMVRVSSSSVVDWPTVEASLSPDVRAGLIGASTYLPDLRPTDRERAEGHWLADVWVFGLPALEAA